MSKSGRIATDGSGPPLGRSPFASLSSVGLPSQIPPAAAVPPAIAAAPPKRNRGRVDIRRETAGRGGRTVTTVSGFTGIGLPEKEELAKCIQKACGVGGTVKDGRIEIQGDKREVAARVLEKAGFQPVFAGG